MFNIKHLCASLLCDDYRKRRTRVILITAIGYDIAEGLRLSGGGGFTGNTGDLEKTTAK